MIKGSWWWHTLSTAAGMTIALLMAAILIRAINY